MATSDDRDMRPSEFGGRPGLIQSVKDGHEPTPAERAYLLRQSDPSDEKAVVLEVGEAAG